MRFEAERLHIFGAPGAAETLDWAKAKYPDCEFVHESGPSGDMHVTIAVFQTKDGYPPLFPRHRMFKWAEIWPTRKA